MKNSNKYKSVAHDIQALGAVIPNQLVEETSHALKKLESALGQDVSGYVANRLHLSMEELSNALAAEQVDGVALAMYNIEKRGQSVIIGDQTGIGKGRQAAAMIRYGLLSGYLPIFFTDRYTLFSDMYRDCKALGIKDAKPLIINNGTSVVDFDQSVEEDYDDSVDEIWSHYNLEDDIKNEDNIFKQYKKQYKIVYKAPQRKVLLDIFNSGDIPNDYDYLMITYSQLKDSKRDMTRLNFLHSLCTHRRVLFVFDEAHRSSSVSFGNVSVITEGINKILSDTPGSQCVFLSATFAKRPENFITFMRRTALSALATETTLEKALHNGGVPMQEYVSSSLAAFGQMIRREHSNENIPSPTYTYLDDDIQLHSELFDRVMYYFREIVKLSDMVSVIAKMGMALGALDKFKCYPTRAQLFYINKVVLLSLKAQRVAQASIENVKNGRSVVIGMSDTLECILQDIIVVDENTVRGDFCFILFRLLEKTVRDSDEQSELSSPIFDKVSWNGSPEMLSLMTMVEELRVHYKFLLHKIGEEQFNIPISPIDVIRQLITRETFKAPDGSMQQIRFEECTGRSHQLEYLYPEGDDKFFNAKLRRRTKRHSNHIFNDFQNNKLDVILVNACGAIGASAHAISTSEVPDDQVRQRIMLIVQNDLDVNIDLQKRGRINRTGQRMDLPPLYEYIITAIPSEKRLNMMLRAKLRSLSANTAAWQDQDKAQADFVDISNKYGNKVANEYLESHQELALTLGIKGDITASKLLARIAMLNVNSQQEIIKDIITDYTTLECELRRINQWDLERVYKDFEAEFVYEELFTTAKANTKLGGCSYLTTYKCKQKTFPYSSKKLIELCEEAKANFGKPYIENTALQTSIRNYYMQKNKNIREQFQEKRKSLYEDTKRIICNSVNDTTTVDRWLNEAQQPNVEWDKDMISEITLHKKGKQIIRKLNLFSDMYNQLTKREKSELKEKAAEKKRLVTVLSKAYIGKGFANVWFIAEENDNNDKITAVLRDIQFGKAEGSKYSPNQVQFVFALSSHTTEIRINLVHYNNRSNYNLVNAALDSKGWKMNAADWDYEISQKNNRIVERKIITGNILGAFVHPAIADLKPRFITFSTKNKTSEKTFIQNGLLLPMDESRIREALKTISLPLEDGIKYATNANNSYVITGIGIDFNLLPCRISETIIRFVISVKDNDSKSFEQDSRFNSVRSLFSCNTASLMCEQKEETKKAKLHYTTKQLKFESDEYQSIIQTLAQLEAVIIIPRDHLNGKQVKTYISQSENDLHEDWPVLEWKNAETIPMPPIQEKTLLRISAPIIAQPKKGKRVFRHSPIYLLAKKTIEMSGWSLNSSSTIEGLIKVYLNWNSFFVQNEESQKTSWAVQKQIRDNLRDLIENVSKKDFVIFDIDVRETLEKILDSEYLEPSFEFISRFENEMIFRSPNIKEAQAFLDEMPYDSSLKGIRKCIQDYIDGKTNIIFSPHRM